MKVCPTSRATIVNIVNIMLYVCISGKESLYYFEINIEFPRKIVSI